MAAALPAIELLAVAGGTAATLDQAHNQSVQAEELRAKQTKESIDLENQAIDRQKQQTSANQERELSSAVQQRTAALAALGKQNSTILTGPGASLPVSQPKTLLGA